MSKLDEVRQADPGSVAQAQAVRVARLRQVEKLAQALLRRSRRVGRAFGRLVAGSVGYAEGRTPVSVDTGGRQWIPRQPRLLLITHDLSASGAPRVVEEVARIFAEAGWFVTVASPVEGPAGDRMTRYATLVIDPTVLQEDSPMLSALGPVSELALANTVVAVGAVNALARITPVFWYLHEVSLLADMLRDDDRLRRAFTVAARVFAGSELSAALARVLRSDIRVLPYGVRALASLSAAAPPGQADTVFVAVFGAIEPRKGQDLAVGALAALPERERATTRLTLYGRVLDQRFHDELDRSVQAMPEVTWGGELAAKAYAAALTAADVVLVSSRDDTLPLVSLDALGAGRVLICTATTGTAAWLEDGVSGFVAERADVEALAATLSRARAHRDDWPAIGRAGRAVFAATFSEGAFAAALLAEASEARRG